MLVAKNWDLSLPAHPSQQAHPCDRGPPRTGTHLPEVVICRNQKCLAGLVPFAGYSLSWCSFVL
jgi:hypothetical protein